MKKRKLVVEVNRKFTQAKDTIVGDRVIMITPLPLDADYWLYRVKLKHGQAILAFPKFGQIGCGFAKEEDWNTNLPISCPAEMIFDHIKHNKRYKDISAVQCIEAIKLIQEVVRQRRTA